MTTTTAILHRTLRLHCPLELKFNLQLQMTSRDDAAALEALLEGKFRLARSCCGASPRICSAEESTPAHIVLQMRLRAFPRRRPPWLPPGAL